MVSTKNMENYINDIPQFRKLVKYFGIEFEPCLLTYDMEPMLLLIIFLRFKGKVKTNNSIKLNRSKVKGFIHQSVFLSITKSDGV